MNTRLALPVLVLLACEASSGSGPGGAPTVSDGGAIDGGADAPPGDADDGGRNDASGDAGGGDAGACAPAWDGTLTMPASGIRWVTGWDQISPTVPNGSTLGMGGTSATDVWFTGEVQDGTAATRYVAHYDGSAVRALAGLPNVTWPVAVVSPTEAWLGPELRYRGGNIERAAKPAPGTTALKFFGSSEGWFIGPGGVWRWDGTDWTAYGKLGAVVPFTAIDGSSATDVWVAAGPLLKHWDGTAWSDPAVPPPPGTDIRMVRAFSPTDVWISGSATYRFDGATWVSWGTRSWIDIQTDGATTYAVGAGAIGIVQGSGFYVTNGNAFPCSGSTSTTGACTSSYMPATGELLLGIKVPTAGGFGIGPYLRPANGGGFNTRPIGQTLTTGPAGPGDKAQLRQLTGGDVLAVSGGKLYRGRYGGTWTELLPPKIASTDQVTGIVGETEDFMWIASSYGATTYLSRYDGATFGPMQITPIPARARKYGASFGSGVDATGNAVLFDGTQWTATVERGVMVSPTEGFRIAYSNGGRTSAIERGLSGVWTAQSPTLPAGDSFVFIDATSPTDVVAVSQKVAVFHWDGTTWKTLSPSRAVDTLTAGISYLGEGRLWINDTGRGGPIRSFDGVCWKDELSTNAVALVTGNRDRLWVWGPKLISGMGSDLRTRVP
jgi:hypothetical protein